MQSSDRRPAAGNRQVEHIRLGDFIRRNVEPIVEEWSRFAETLTPASTGMTALALRDHIVEILTFVANDLESPQTGTEQTEKSQGDTPKEGGGARSAAEVHAAGRLSDGFDIDQMVAEYRALRASVVKLWRANKSDLDGTDFDDLTRFHEAIDQATTESIAHYTKTIDQSRNLFLGILGHDLRNPMGAASMSAELMCKVGTLNAKQTYIASQIIAAMSRANVILTDLLDLTRIQLGSEIPVAREPMEMAVVAGQLVEEMRSLYPGREIPLTTDGNTEGEWDKSRIGQVFSNLIGNAIEHGFADTAIQVSVTGVSKEVTLSVHNQGRPIPDDRRGNIFESLVQGESGNFGSAHLGLGLYIVKKLVEAHGGTIDVTSSERDGTAFTARLPRH